MSDGAFGTYDFETYDWTSPLCADLFDGAEHTFSLDREDPTAVVRSMLAEMEASDIDVWWAHNGGKFDALFVVDCVKQLPGWKCDGTVAGGRIISLRLFSPNGTFTLKDSYAVIQASLEKALTSFDIPHKKVFTKADYAQLEKDPRAMLKHSDVKLREGCQADTRALWHLVDKARVMFEEWGGKLKSTFSASALTVVKAQYGKPLASHAGKQNFNEISHSAYSGGRVEVYRHMPALPQCEHDLISSYPWSMTQPLPWHLEGFGESKIYDPNTLSVVYAKVDVPKQYLPPLPYAPPSGGLFFPWGKWSGWFTSAELVYAIEHCGVTATFMDAVNYTVDTPFKEFVEKVFKVKQESTGAKREFTKLILNGCYGKFAEKPERGKLHMFATSDEAWDWATKAYKRKRHVTPLNQENTAWEEKVHRWPAHTHYALASFVTAYSRIRWHQGASEVLRRNTHGLSYGDTDSIHCDMDLGPMPVGAGLGDWQRKRENYLAKFFAPKLYTLKPCDGAESVYASKGFPVSADAFWRIVGGQKVGNPKGRMQLVKTQLKKNASVTHLSEGETLKRWHGYSIKRFAIPKHPEGDTEAWNVRDLHEGLHEKQQSALAPIRPK